ncbi:MAG: sporulation transcriptional regulator SpoIIID [Bacilli bacterium]
MENNILKRVISEADYIIKTGKTVREIAKIYNVSKSTVHKDLHERLLEIDKNKYTNVDKILKYHIDIRHIRGGQSTKEKYQNLTLEL